MRKILTLTAVLAVSAFGTVFAEEENPDFKKVFGGLVLTDGNSETLNASLGAGMKKSTDKHEFLADILYLYAESTIETTTGEGDEAVTTEEDETTVDKLTAAGQVNHKFNDTYYAYSRADYLKDDIALVDYRVTLGLGLGTKIGPFSVELGGAYIDEEVDGVSDDKVAVRIFEKSEHTVGEGAKVYQQVEYLPTADDWSDDYLVNAKAGIDAAVNSTLSLTAFVINTYDSTPAAGLDENDLSINIGFTANL